MIIDFRDKVVNYVIEKDLYSPCYYNNFTEIYKIINDYILDEKREVPANEKIRICYDITIKCIAENDNSITVYANIF